MVKKIAIIGAGPSGLAALKAALDAPQFKAGQWDVVVYEARVDLGGVWLPSSSSAEPHPETPVYDSLTTNLPHPTMSFHNFPYPPGTPLFPGSAHVLAYLRLFAATFGLRPFIRFGCKVERVEWGVQGRWVIRTNQSEVVADLLIVCNGHYALPRYPSTPGLAHWLSPSPLSGLPQLPPKATHAIHYRTPLPLYPPRTKVLVVGAGPSGRDISCELASAGCVVLHSLPVAPKNPLTLPGYPNLRTLGPVREYAGREAGEVWFEDGSVERGVERVVVATGYQYSYPFFEEPVKEEGATEVADPSAKSTPILARTATNIDDQDGTIYNTTYGLFPLARHIWPLPTPSSPPSSTPASSPSHLPTPASPALSRTPPYPPHALAFLGLPIRVSPIPLAEQQAKAVLAVFVAAERESRQARDDGQDEGKGVEDTNKDLIARVFARMADEVQERWARLDEGIVGLEGLAGFGGVKGASEGASERGSKGGTKDDFPHEIKGEQKETTPRVPAPEILKRWHTFEPMDQYDYRDALAELVEYLSLLPSPDSEPPSTTTSTKTSSSPPSVFTSPPTPSSQTRVPAWERTAYALKDVLRDTWVAIEAAGEAGEWLSGVGVRDESASASASGRDGTAEPVKSPRPYGNEKDKEEGGLEDVDEVWRDWVRLMWRVARRGEEDRKAEAKTG